LCLDLHVHGQPSRALGDPGGGLLLPERGLLPARAHALPVMAMPHAGTDDREEAPEEEAEEEPLPEAAHEHDQCEEHQSYDVDHAPLVRAVTRAAYRAGARWVGADYRDEHLRRALVELAPEEALTWTPPWTLTRIETLAEEGGALIAIHGDPEPNLLADLDG